MELTQAIQLINEAITAKQAEIDTLNLTLTVLENQFAPELTVLDNARQEVVDAKAEIITAKVATNIAKQETEALEARVAELEAVGTEPKE